jgi:hypothetical protein
MEKVFVGSAKSGETQHGGYLKVQFKESDFEMMRRFANDKGYTTLFISKRKEVGKYGDTHSITVAPPREPSNEYNPQNPQENSYAQATSQVNNPNVAPQPSVTPLNGVTESSVPF